MDPTLAAIYGTSQVSEEDIDKLAAAELAEKLASGEAELDEETLEALANEVLAQEAAEVEEPEKTEETKVEEPEKTAEEAKTEEVKPEEKKPEVKAEPKPEEKPAEKTAEAEPELTEEQQKFAEADYLGRVMAHAFAQESRDIEKVAKKVPPSFLAKAKGKAGEVAGKVGAHIKKNKFHYEEGAVGAAGFGIGRASKKGKEKKSSALDTLIMQRAAELCQENGVDPAVLSQEPEKQAEGVSPYDVLAARVEEGAWELLKSKGLVETEEPVKE